MHGLLQIREREEVSQPAGFQLGRSFGPVTNKKVSQSVRLQCEGHRSSNPYIPQVLIDQPVRILIGESQHAAAGMFDQHDLLGSQKLLGDDDTA